MPKRVHITLLIDGMPDDRFAAAELLFRLSAPWQTLCKLLDDTGIKHSTEIDERQVRSKRRKRDQPHVVAPASEAA